MNSDERSNDETRVSEALEEDPRKRDWNYFEYLDKVEQEMAAGRFASQSK